MPKPQNVHEELRALREERGRGTRPAPAPDPPDASALGQAWRKPTPRPCRRRQAIARFAHHPLDNLLPNLIVPLAGAVVKGLRKSDAGKD
jgi:hypothetical protein